MPDDEASDRAAILARRKRFVTATLTGLAVVAGTTAATACPCLKMAPTEPEPSGSNAPAGVSEDAPSDGAATDDAAPGETKPDDALPAEAERSLSDRVESPER